MEAVHVYICMAEFSTDVPANIDPLTEDGSDRHEHLHLIRERVGQLCTDVFES